MTFNKIRLTTQHAFLPVTLSFTLQACMPSIWNAGDLADWVRGQAVEQGCQEDSVVLEDWYRETMHGNVWHGTCLKTTGEAQEFAVNVDSVWTPSEP